MRKIAMVMIGVAFLASAAQANVFVGWTANAGFYWTGGGEPGILAGGGTTIAQLIWTPDDTVSAADANSLNYLTDGEQLLNEITLTEGVNGIGEYAYWTTQIKSNDLGANPLGGWIYARIFQDATVDVDDYYYAGPVVAASDLDPGKQPPDAAQRYEMNFGDGSFGSDAIDGEHSAQVVPEPASLSLLALGAVVLGFRRRRR